MTDPAEPAPPAAIDHLVYATVDLTSAVDRLHEALGVRPSVGGRHVGRGTCNYLLALGEGVYLEIVGVDPTQPEPDRPRPFGIDTLASDRLLTWAVRVGSMEATLAGARAAGFDPGAAEAMSRANPDGERLAWRLTPAFADGDGLVPFLVAWETTTHPSTTAASGAHLAAFTATSTDAATVIDNLAAVGAAGLLDVRAGAQAALAATVVGPAGEITLT